MVLIYTDPQGKGLCSRPVTSRLNPLKSRILLKKSKKTSNKTKKDTTGQPCLFITLGYLSFCEETRYSVSENETDIPWKHPLALFHLISSSFSSPHACVQPLHQQFLFFLFTKEVFSDLPLILVSHRFWLNGFFETSPQGPVILAFKEATTLLVLLSLLLKWYTLIYFNHEYFVFKQNNQSQDSTLNSQLSWT